MQLVVLRLRRRPLVILLLERIVFESAMFFGIRRVHPWLFIWIRTLIRPHRFLLLSFFYIAQKCSIARASAAMYFL